MPHWADDPDRAFTGYPQNASTTQTHPKDDAEDVYDNSQRVQREDEQNLDGPNENGAAPG